MKLPDRNPCTESGCHAGCCTDTVLHISDPKSVLPWLQEAGYQPIQSPEELQEIQDRINNHEVTTDPGSLHPLMRRNPKTGKIEGVDIYIEGLCPSNSGNPDYNCNAINRPRVCSDFPLNGFSCAVQRNS